jgi:hypothetical protein
VKSAPEELNAWVVPRQAPPLPFLPDYVHGKLPTSQCEIFIALIAGAANRVPVNATAYGTNYDRLVRIKKQYDPENFFYLNQNIKR